MHWLNMSAHTAGAEEIIQHIKRHCKKKKKNKNKTKVFILLYLSKSFYAAEIMSPHSVGELLKMQRLCRRQAEEGEASWKYECMTASIIFLMELHCRTAFVKLFFAALLRFK